MLDHNKPDVPDPFAYARDRVVRIAGYGTDVRWYRCRWTPQNLGVSYTPLFQAVDPECLAKFSLVIPQGNYGSDTLAFFVWRVQAPGMIPSEGLHRLRYNLGRLSIVPDPREIEVGPAG